MENKLGRAWVHQHVTLFADDLCVAVSFSSSTQMHAQLQNIGIVIDCIESLGLSISPSKSHALVSIRGTQQHKHQNTIVQRHGHGSSSIIPRAHGPLLIPITDRVKYLGVIISFKGSPMMTVNHRIKARITFARLRKWLISPHMNVMSRLQLWRSCVFASMQYGLISMTIPLPGILKIQTECVGMLRKIIRNPSFLTHQSHSDALTPYRQFWPLSLLRAAVTRFQPNHHSRLDHLPHDDIIHMSSWDHLPHLTALIEHAQDIGPLSSSPSLPSSLLLPYLGAPFAPSPHHTPVHCADTRPLFMVAKPNVLIQMSFNKGLLVSPNATTVSKSWHPGLHFDLTPNVPPVRFQALCQQLQCASQRLQLMAP